MWVAATNMQWDRFEMCRQSSSFQADSVRLACELVSCKLSFRREDKMMSELTCRLVEITVVRQLVSTCPSCPF